ncbi:MAG TPA: PPK2 family polyphosphate kinase [Rhodoglobus sp.]|nr:PPK2 family polyphosphate kinase [Rhodoglobus sp.]
MDELDSVVSTAVGDGFVLADVDTASTPGFTGGKKQAEAALEHNAKRLAELQERLYAESKFEGTRSVLLVLQAMDTAGKGGIIRHVVGGVDPQGVKVHAFKAPTDEEREHDFLWRIRRQLPEPGQIAVFDRSHYEDVLIHRVRGFSEPDVIEERYGVIRDFEREVVDAGTSVIKVMLHISPDEQRARLEARLARPEKRWKFNPGDIDERQHWPAYMEAYQIALERTAAPEAPWFVVPADRKWYARWAVQTLLLRELERLEPQWPVPDFDVEEQQRRLAQTAL